MHQFLLTFLKFVFKILDKKWRGLLIIMITIVLFGTDKAKVNTV